MSRHGFAASAAGLIIRIYNNFRAAESQAARRDECAANRALSERSEVSRESGATRPAAQRRLLGGCVGLWVVLWVGVWVVLWVGLWVDVPPAGTALALRAPRGRGVRGEGPRGQPRNASLYVSHGGV